MTNRNHSPADEVERLLRAIEPENRRGKVRQTVDNHFREPGRCDRRGRRSAKLKKVATTLRHMVGMQRWALDESYDLNVRRRVGDFLKHVDHNQSWARTVDECSKARGLVNGAARKRNEQKELGPGEPATLSEAYTSYPLNTVAKVRAGGRRGGNCLRDNDFGYLDQLRDGEAEFHEIRKSDEAVAWLRVERESREITDIYGPGNEEAELPVGVLWELCRKLDVGGDDEELFLGNGVLTMFLDGTAEREKPMRVVRDYEFWWRRREIVAHDSRDDRWSRFVWRRTGWRAAGPSHIDGDTFKVMRRLVPAIASLARAALPIRPRRPGKRKPTAL